MLRTARTIVGAAGVVLITVLASQAADVNKALSEAEGRKRAAENGLKEIKSKDSCASELNVLAITAEPPLVEGREH